CATLTRTCRSSRRRSIPTSMRRATSCPGWVTPATASTAPSKAWSVITIAAYAGAAVAEIAGCFAFWTWLRQGASTLWLLPGLLSLAAFAWLLSFADVAAAGRAYAAYGGVYIIASLGWLWLVEGVKPDRWDALGAAVCLLGAGIILFAPRGA